MGLFSFLKRDDAAAAAAPKKSAKAGAKASNDADYFHYALEAWKVRDPLRRVADPERWPVDFDEHLTDAHAKTLFGKIDPKKAMRFERTTPDDARDAVGRRGPRVRRGPSLHDGASGDEMRACETWRPPVGGPCYYRPFDFSKIALT